MRAWIDVNLDRLTHNVIQIQNQVLNKKIMAIIKANAYGHGAFAIAKHLSNLGIEYFGVATSEEAFLLREEGIKSTILILSSVPLEEFEEIALKNIQITISSPEEIKFLYEKRFFFRKNPLKIHIKVDTGMGRIGFKPLETIRAIRIIKRLKVAEICGLYTHLSDADGDSLQSHEYTQKQISDFDLIVQKVLEKYSIEYIHILNSAGILRFPKLSKYENMVRPGLILYGVYPCNFDTIKLKQIMTFKSKILFVKKIEASLDISYGRSYTAKSGEIIATVPIGYADGLFRNLSNNWDVEVTGQKCSIVGRICMDNLMINASNIRKPLHKDVILLGENISIYKMADVCGTIPWEILTSINPRITKLYFKDEELVCKVTLLQNSVYNNF
ncbi:MAG: alanine racemase [Fusobacteria bacterium]|nr:alanine racemase [Fusobacteriota bacterium]